MNPPPSKPARMELRKAIGNRAVPGPRYHRGPDYLVAHACFGCRKSWKRPDDRDHACPECGEPLAAMGRTCLAARRAGANQWEKARRLWGAGFRFCSHRSFPGAEQLPECLREVDGFSRRNVNHPMRVKR